MINTLIFNYVLSISSVHPDAPFIIWHTDVANGSSDIEAVGLQDRTRDR